LPVKFSWIIHKNIWVTWRGSQPFPVRVSKNKNLTKEKSGLIKNYIRFIFFFFLRMVEVKRCKRKSKEKLKNIQKK
jgi:hypothetical protein